MNIQDGYNSGKKVFTFDTQDRIYDKLDKMTSMMSKLTAQGSSQNRLFKPMFTKVKEEDKLDIMLKIDIKIGTDQTVEIGACHIEVELNIDKTIKECHSMINITEMTLGEEILEELKTKEVKILEVDIKVTLGTITLVQVEVGLEKDSTWVTLREMREAIVDQDQVQE